MTLLRVPSQPAKQQVHLLLLQCAASASEEWDEMVAGLLGPALVLQELLLQAEEAVLPIQHLPVLQVQLPIHPAMTKMPRVLNTQFNHIETKC